MERKRHRSHIRKRAVAGGIAALLLGMMTACAPHAWAKTECFAMDTYNVLEADADPSVLHAAAARLNELEQIFSRSREDAALYRLNTAGTLPRQELPEELQLLLEESKRLCAETQGAFDPTLGVLVDLWNVGGETPRVPEAEAIRQAQGHCGVDNLSLGDTIMLANGMQLDLGAVAKGYATDLLADQLREDGVENALLSLGGNVYTMGSKNGKPFQVGIADPKEPAQLIGKLSVGGGKAVVTSGDYQRYFEADGKRYHHILDVQTGAPVDSGLSAVTVVADSGLLADAYSTALFVLGKERGLQMVEADDRLEAIFIETDGTVTCSSGLEDVFTR